MPRGITCFLVPADTPGVKVEEYLWTFNMPTDHPRVSFTDVWVPADALFGEEGRGLALAQSFVHENRIRQAASSLGAAAFCVAESVKYARERKPFGEELARNQGIQFPLVELATQVEMLRLLIRKTAWEMDQMPHPEVEKKLSDKVSMCNYWANRLVCEAADRAMQVHGGIGYSAATSRSSTSTATTAATASPKAARKSRCARWRPSCSAISGRTASDKRPQAVRPRLLRGAAHGKMAPDCGNRESTHPQRRHR